MDSGLKKIFWGIIFITFHINLGSLPIVPNFIGWIIIFTGLNTLGIFLSKKSQILIVMGVIMIFTSLIGDFVTIFQVNLYNFGNMNLILSIILEFIFFYFLFELLFTGLKRDVIYQRVYILLSTGYIFISTLVLIVPFDSSKIVLGSLLGLVIRIILLVYISEKRKELEMEKNLLNLHKISIKKY